MKCRPEFEGKYHCKFCEHQAFLDLLKENVKRNKNEYNSSM